MEIRFDGKTALVTGAGKGIGRAVASALHKCGARVFAVSRTQADLDSLKAENPGIETVALDVCDWQATREAITSMGVIDLLVNNAGVAKCFPFLDIEEDQIDSVFNVNVKALINISQVVAQQMVTRKQGGAVVNVSSQASQRALTDHAVYCASKAAVDAITRSMAFELGPHQIRVNSVNPTVVWTEMSKANWKTEEKCKKMTDRIPLGHFAEVQDVVNGVLFLLSDKAAMMSGACLPIEGGFWAC